MQNRPDDRIYAGFFVRLAAYLVDILIVWAAMLVVRVPVWIATVASPDNFLVKDFIFQYSIKDILFYLMQAAYFILLTYFTGSTLGKKLFQIRVVSVEDRKMTFFEVVFRETVGRFLSALILSIGYIMIAIDKKKRGLHDILSDTNVVYYHEKRIYTHADVYYRNMVNTSDEQAVAQPRNPYEVEKMQSQDLNETVNTKQKVDESVTLSKPETILTDMENPQIKTVEPQNMPSEYFKELDNADKNEAKESE